MSDQALLWFILALAISIPAAATFGIEIGRLRERDSARPRLVPGERIEFRDPSGPTVSYTVVHIRKELNGPTEVELQPTAIVEMRRAEYEAYERRNVIDEQRDWGGRA